MTKFREQKGFTLIELLVVISIIGILASMILSSLQDAQASARDATRLSDMRQIRTALELFYNDHGRYPDKTHDSVSDSGEYIGSGDHIDDALRPYLDPIPKDPLDNHLDPLPVYFYSYDSHHNVEIDPDKCALPTTIKGAVYGFNKAEVTGNLQKETCSGLNMNLNNADYNQAMIRSSF